MEKRNQSTFQDLDKLHAIVGKKNSSVSCSELSFSQFQLLVLFQKKTVRRLLSCTATISCTRTAGRSLVDQVDSGASSSSSQDLKPQNIMLVQSLDLPRVDGVFLFGNLPLILWKNGT